MFWCFHCYALNDYPTGRCYACGDAIEAPAGLPRSESLIWALHHPDGDRAVLAARILGRLRVRESVQALRETAQGGKDIFLRAEALRSLIVIEGAEALRPWLDELSIVGPFNVRAIARQALDATAEADAAESAPPAS